MNSVDMRNDININYDDTEGGGVVQFNGHWTQWSPVVLCGALDIDQSLTERVPVSCQHAVSWVGGIVLDLGSLDSILLSAIALCPEQSQPSWLISPVC